MGLQVVNEKISSGLGLTQCQLHTYIGVARECTGSTYTPGRTKNSFGRNLQMKVVSARFHAEQEVNF